VIRISAKYLDSGKPKMRNDIFAAIVAQWLNIALPSHKVATPASFVAMHDL
jgi:hypothetical protein